MVIIYYLLLCAGGIFSAVILWRSGGIKKVPAVLAWMGGLMALASFFLMPWINFGPPGSIQENTKWLAEQTVVIEALKQVPGLDRLLETTNTWTAADIWNVLDHPIKDQIYHLAESGELITGPKMMHILSQVNDLDTYLMKFAVAMSIIGIIVGLLGMSKIIKIPWGVSVVIAFLAGMAFIGLLSIIPTLDQLDAGEEIQLRLLMVMAEARVASGAGWSVGGLFLLIISSFLNIVLSQTDGAEQAVEENSYY